MDRVQLCSEEDGLILKGKQHAHGGREASSVFRGPGRQEWAFWWENGEMGSAGEAPGRWDAAASGRGMRPL